MMRLKSKICPTSLEVGKALEVHQQFTLFCEIGKEMRGSRKGKHLCTKRDYETKKKNLSHYFNIL